MSVGICAGLSPPTDCTAMADCLATIKSKNLEVCDREKQQAFSFGKGREWISFAAINPHVNKLTIHILAAVVEDEAERMANRGADP